jgi:hypothetical protein
VTLPLAKFAPLTETINMLDQMMAKLELSLIPSKPSKSEKVINFKVARDLDRTKAA